MKDYTCPKLLTVASPNTYMTFREYKNFLLPWRWPRIRQRQVVGHYVYKPILLYNSINNQLEATLTIY